MKIGPPPPPQNVTYNENNAGGGGCVRSHGIVRENYLFNLITPTCGKVGDF